MACFAFHVRGLCITQQDTVALDVLDGVSKSDIVGQLRVRCARGFDTFDALQRTTQQLDAVLNRYVVHLFTIELDDLKDVQSTLTSYNVNQKVLVRYLLERFLLFVSELTLTFNIVVLLGDEHSLALRIIADNPVACESTQVFKVINVEDAMHRL